jgi:hypothetical protein
LLAMKPRCDYTVTGAFFARPPVHRSSGGPVQDGPLLQPIAVPFRIHLPAQFIHRRRCRAQRLTDWWLCRTDWFAAHPLASKVASQRSSRQRCLTAACFRLRPSSLSPHRQHPDLLLRRFPAHAQVIRVASAAIHRVLQKHLRNVSAQPLDVIGDEETTVSPVTLKGLCPCNRFVWKG